MTSHFDTKIVFSQFIVALTVYLFSGAVIIEGLIPVVAPQFMGVTTILRYLLLIALLIINYRENSHIVINKQFTFFFIVYSLYVLFYMTVDREIPLGKMLRVPTSVSSYLGHWLYLFSLMLCCKSLVRYLNIRLLLILYITLTLLPSLWYISIIGFETFQVVSVENHEAQFIGPLTFSYQCSMVLVFAIFFNNEISKWKMFNLAILIFVFVCTGYAWLAATKRGPILWTFIAVLIIYYHKDKNTYNYLFRVGIIVGILYILGPYILNIAQELAPYSVSRIYAAIFEGDTSHRLTSGDSDNGWTIAIEQWTHDFLSFSIGSYFRILKPGGMFYGLYPHNVFLELALTMGLFGVSFFCYLLKKSFDDMRCVLNSRYSKELFFFFCMFVIFFLTMLTTDSVILNYCFWVSFALLTSKTDLLN